MLTMMIQVNKIALLIRRGIIKTRAQREAERKQENETKLYDIWEQGWFFTLCYGDKQIIQMKSILFRWV